MSQFTPSSATRIPFQSNPFSDLTAGSPWTDTSADVGSINQLPFQLIWRRFQQVLRGDSYFSIWVTGEPGSGKTHLLSRFKKKVEAIADPKPWYVYARCNASAQTIWRQLQRALAGDLLQVKLDSQARLANLVTDYPQRLDKINHLGVHRALTHLAQGHHALSAAAWLRGDTLAESDLLALGIGVEKENEERSRETEARLVIEALLRFLAPDPVVICLDQVETIETHPGEVGGYRTLGQLVSNLEALEEKKLFLISCIVSDYEDKVHKNCLPQDVDRWRQQTVNLKPIEWPQAIELINVRLSLSPSVRELRQTLAINSTWPLDEAPLRALFNTDGHCVPRKLIRACRIEFDKQMGDPEPVLTISRDELLQNEFHRRLQDGAPQLRTRGAESILLECLPWLLQNRGLQVNGPADNPPHFSMSASTPSGNTPSGNRAFLFAFRPGNPFTSTLRKPVNSWQGTPSLTILSDPAIQPKPGSKGAEYLAALKTRGARLLHPTAEALAVLWAIRDLTSAAKSGELSLNGETITESEATQWALANMPPQLEAFANQLIEPGQPDDQAKTRLLALLSQHKLISANEAAQQLSLSIEEVSACARRYPLHFAVLEGPPLVLFQVLEGSEANTSHA